MIRKLSPAKVNLYLRVLRKRQDGYHDIASLMQQISIYDDMIFMPADREIRVHCPGSDLPEDVGNIIYRAARAFFRHAPYLSGGIDITVNKRIPIAAGLGGGSSNAATTLLALNEIYGHPFSKERLIQMGAQLGADVPFFIFGTRAWALGIGDRLQTTGDIPSFHLLLVNPGFELSTRTIYQNLTLRLTNSTIHYSIPRFLTVRDLAEGLCNDLETVSMGMHPVLGDIKNSLMANGALGTLMSGSGPTVFGIFEKEEQAVLAERALAGINAWSVFRASSL